MADLGLNQRFMLAYAASINTITVSIPLPNAKINEKLVRKFNVNHKNCKMINVIKNETIIATVAIIDCFTPIKIAVINVTNNIALTPFHHNDI
jgi:hypothetical protein